MMMPVVVWCKRYRRAGQDCTDVRFSVQRHKNGDVTVLVEEQGAKTNRRIMLEFDQCVWDDLLRELS